MNVSAAVFPSRWRDVTRESPIDSMGGRFQYRATLVKPCIPLPQCLDCLPGDTHLIGKRSCASEIMDKKDPSPR